MRSSPQRQGPRPRARRKSNRIFLRAALRRRRLRRLGLALLLFAAAGFGAWYALTERGRASQPKTEPMVRVLEGHRVMVTAKASRLRAWGHAGRRRWLAAVPARRAQRAGKATIVLQLQAPALGRRLERALDRGGGDIQAPYRPTSSTIDLPIFRQALHNNCETAALSILMRAQGIAISQIVLQRQLPRSLPLDPQARRGGIVWGDPSLGFVGRADGGGPAGGYGVYAPPVAKLAARHGASLKRIVARKATTIYAALLRGEPVMAWVGLSGGPYRTWGTPAGKRVTGNLGEHTVVLSGLSSAGIRVHDPLTGTVQRWTRARFELQWRRLGRQALIARRTSKRS